MPDAVLITECLQNDFVQPLEPGTVLPNLLHVGHEEARRLMGADPASGPISRVMAWAYRRPVAQLAIIHLRDWHDPDDPFEKTHLAQFGNHCIAGSPGAEFAFSPPLDGPKRAIVINTLTLNGFQGTNLADILGPLARPGLPVGLMGAWTEAKITFLAYELRTRYPDLALAVCSALTASSSRTRHFLALEQLERILGVRILASVGQFLEFLGGPGTAPPLAATKPKHPRLSWSGKEAPDPDEQLIRYLFRDCRAVDLTPASGGYSGSRVLLAKSMDLFGHEQVPHVVKIGPQDLIGQERMAFERIEAVLGNSAPAVSDFADLEGRGAIKYRYASMDGRNSTTFQKRYMAGMSIEEVRGTWDRVFKEQLGRLYRAARRESRDLLEDYGFSPRWADAVQNRVDELMGAGASNGDLIFPGNRPVMNVARFYRDFFPVLPRRRRPHYQSWVHGDLNGANIILDGRDNVWLIDFFHTRQAHVLTDLIKLENDLKYIFTPISGPEEFEEALRLTDLLLAVKDLGRPLPPSRGLTSPQLLRAWAAISLLRSYYPALIHEDTDPLQLWIGELRYAVHTLSFPESNPWQKKWALYAAGCCATRIKDRLWHYGPLRLDWLPPVVSGAEDLALTILPGRRDYARNLGRDLAQIRAQGVTHLATLVTNEELDRYGVTDLVEAAGQAGLLVRRQPIPDMDVPSREEMAGLVAWLDEVLGRGGRVLIHCVGGLGRSGTVAACWLISRGLSADQAVVAVRTARSARCIESEAQMDFVQSW